MTKPAAARVFASLDLAHAELVRQILEVEGIEARVANDQVVGLGGVLPIDQCMALVWVDAQDVERAQRILAELRSSATTTEPTDVCPRCQSPLGAELAVCWKCGALQEGIDSVAFEPAPAPEPRHAGFGTYALYAIGVLVLLSIVFAVVEGVFSLRP